MEDYIFEIVMTGIGIIISIIVGIISRYFKRNEDRLDENDKKLEAKIDEFGKELTDYKLDVARDFVSKDEFIRTLSRVDNKLDKIYDEIMRQRKEECK